MCDLGLVSHSKVCLVVGQVQVTRWYSSVARTLVYRHHTLDSSLALILFPHTRTSHATTHCKLLTKHTWTGEMTSEHSKVEIQTSSSLQDAFGKPEYSLHGFRRRLGRISQSRSKTGTDGHPSSSENLINKEEEPRRQTDSNRNKGALTEFHLFGCLPPEIRLLIWEHATQYKRRVGES